MASKGKQQRANSQRGRLQRPDLSQVYDQRVRSIEPGDFTFRTLLIRPEKPRADRYLPLDRSETSLEWSDGDGSVLTGSLSLRRPGPFRVAAVPVLRGHRVRLQLLWGGRWRVLWDMQVQDPPPVDVKTGSLTVNLSDPLSALHMNEKEWEFKKDKRHPKGWTADEITRAVCRDQRVRIGKLAQGRRRIKKLKLKGSGLEVIRKVWAMEKAESGVRFVIRFRDGRLTVLPFQRPSTAYIIKGIEKGAETSASAPSLHPTTVIKATGHIKQGGKAKKVEETVSSRNGMKRFGYSRKEKDYGRVESRAELREEAMRDLAEAVKLERSATLTIPGVPFLEKGSQVIWRTHEPGWSGKVGDTNRDRAFAWVTSARHSLGPASYDTEIVLSQDDIYFNDRKRRDEERRDDKKKRAQRAQRRSGGTAEMSITDQLDSDLMISRRAFAVAQEAFSGSVLRVAAEEAQIGWHSTDTHPETGSVALVREDGDLVDLVGEVVRVERRLNAETRVVYAYVYATGTILDDSLSLAAPSWASAFSPTRTSRARSRWSLDAGRSRPLHRADPAHSSPGGRARCPAHGALRGRPAQTADAGGRRLGRSPQGRRR